MVNYWTSIVNRCLFSQLRRPDLELGLDSAMLEARSLWSVLRLQRRRRDDLHCVPDNPPRMRVFVLAFALQTIIY